MCKQKDESVKKGLKRNIKGQNPVTEMKNVTGGLTGRRGMAERISGNQGRISEFEVTSTDLQK